MFDYENHKCIYILEQEYIGMYINRGLRLALRRPIFLCMLTSRVMRFYTKIESHRNSPISPGPKRIWCLKIWIFLRIYSKTDQNWYFFFPNRIPKPCDDTAALSKFLRLKEIKHCLFPAQHAWELLSWNVQFTPITVPSWCANARANHNPVQVSAIPTYLPAAWSRHATKPYKHTMRETTFKSSYAHTRPFPQAASLASSIFPRRRAAGTWAPHQAARHATPWAPPRHVQA